MDAASSLNGLQRLVNFHLGGSLYLMPFIFAAAGPSCALLMTIVCAVLTFFVYELILDAALVTRKGSFGNIIATGLGSRCAATLRLMVVLNALGVVVAYAQTVVDVYRAVAGESVHVPPAPSPQVQAPGGPRPLAPGALDVDDSSTCRWYFLVTFLAGLVMSALLDARFGHVADWGSLIANFSLLALVAICLACPAADESNCMAVDRSETWGAATVRFGHALIFAFTSAEYVLYACNVADERGELLPDVADAELRSRVRRIGGASLLVSAALYVFVGSSGLWAFGACVKEDVLLNLAPSMASAGWANAFAAVLAVNAMSLVLSFPVFVQTLLLYLNEFLAAHVLGNLPARDQWSAFLDPERPWLGAAWVVPAACAVLHFVPGLQWIIDLVCSWTDVFFMFVFPPLIFIGGAGPKSVKLCATLLLSTALALNGAKWYEML